MTFRPKSPVPPVPQWKRLRDFVMGLIGIFVLYALPLALLNWWAGCVLWGVACP